jgi:hypothetical protein
MVFLYLTLQVNLFLTVYCQLYEELKSVGLSLLCLILWFLDNTIYIDLSLTVYENSAGMFLAKSTFLE